jgi:hypothetical protein
MNMPSRLFVEVVLPAARRTAAINLVLRDRRRLPVENAVSELFSLPKIRRVGAQLIRTFWLGFTFLIILAGAGSFRFAFGHFDTANASGIVLPEQDRSSISKIVLDTLTKADQLPVAFAASVTPSPDTAELVKAAYSAIEALNRTPPSVVTPDVVEQPTAVEQPAIVEPQAAEVVRRQTKAAAAPVVRKAKIEKPKPKQPKPDAIAGKSSPAVDLKTCQLEEFEAFRYAFSLPTGCHASASGLRTGTEMPIQPRADAT